MVKEKRESKIGNEVLVYIKQGLKMVFKKLYNEKIEDFSTRVLYFFNTIDTYFFIAGAGCFFLYHKPWGQYNPLFLLMISLIIPVFFKIVDFSPFFVLLSPICLLFLFMGSGILLQEVLRLLILNIGLCVLIQFVFMGIPDSIVARDPTIGFRKIWNSLFTIAPTTVSMSMSAFFSTFYSLVLFAQPGLGNRRGILFWVTLCLTVFISGAYRPKSFVSPDIRPPVRSRLVDKVIVLNIDGCRLDRFYEAHLPFLSSLEKEGVIFPKGLQTVYRALTNPAFASILTGTLPEIHGIKNNNLGQKIKVEALPDIVATKLYGSMHVKHFSKKHWQTKIVSLPTHSIYRSDRIMFDWLKEDILMNDGTRLFIADISEVDFLGHAYGSESVQYLSALRRVDALIACFWQWLNEKRILKNAAVIICSDHGIAGIDHSYLLFDAERYVPCIIAGAQVRKNHAIEYQASIMDIAPTISYLLGIRYPSFCTGRVFLEALV